MTGRYLLFKVTNHDIGIAARGVGVLVADLMTLKETFCLWTLR